MVDAAVDAREAPLVDQTLNPVLLAVRPSKTMAFTDMATQMREAGVDVSHLRRVSSLRKEVLRGMWARSSWSAATFAEPKLLAHRCPRS